MRIISQFFITFFTFFTLFPIFTGQRAESKKFDWAVVGAGPAGMVALEILLEKGIPAQSIAWIDPEFKVGAMGKDFQEVPANLNTRQWLAIMDRCSYFKRCPFDIIDYLKRYDLDHFYPLKLIVYPLQKVTDWLLHKVIAFQQKIIRLESDHGTWRINLNDSTSINAQKVILATGAHPRSLDYPVEDEIPLSTALNFNKLAETVKKDDIVAVVGSSHSAAIVLMHLAQLPVHKIIHFYNRPFEYVMQTPQGPVNVESGLKGPAAEFAHKIENNLPTNMIRVFNDQQARETWLSLCSKIIYAVGFEPNASAFSQPLSYDDTTGVIAPNLFGIGIAFPEKKADAAGKIEHRVGIPHFLDYGQRVIPQWIAA